MKSTKVQRREIKVRQRKLGMDDVAYHGFLSAWGVESCTELNREQAEEAIDVLEEMLVEKGLIVKPRGFWRDAPRDLKTRYDELLPRDARLATPQQLRHLEGLWVQVTRQKSWGAAMAAFKEFLQRRFGIGDILWIQREEVGKIEHLLRVMKEQVRRLVFTGFEGYF